MKRRANKAKSRHTPFQVWTFAQAMAAIPYIRSILTSLREHAQDILSWKGRGERLAALPGRPDRDTLIATQDASREQQRAEGRFEEAAEELEAVNVYCADPVQGQALLPFIHDEQPAWYLFDLFDPKPLRFWRYHNDPDDTRRPVAALQGQASS